MNPYMKEKYKDELRGLEETMDEEKRDVFDKAREVDGRISRIENHLKTIGMQVRYLESAYTYAQEVAKPSAAFALDVVFDLMIAILGVVEGLLERLLDIACSKTQPGWGSADEGTTRVSCT